MQGNTPHVMISYEMGTDGPSFEEWWLSLVESDRLCMAAALDWLTQAEDFYKWSSDYDGGELYGPGYERFKEQRLTELAALYCCTYSDLQDMMDMYLTHYGDWGFADRSIAGAHQC